MPFVQLLYNKNLALALKVIPRSSGYEKQTAIFRHDLEDHIMMWIL